jgi:hypothetical protein
VVVPDGVAVRVVVTAVPPAVMVLPPGGMTPAEVIQTYGRIYARAGGFAKDALRGAGHLTAEKLTACRRELAGRVSHTALAAAARTGLGRDQVNRWLDRMPSVGWPARGPEPKVGRLEADRTRADVWERFTVVAHPDGTVSFRSHTGFLCAEAGGGGAAACNRPWAKDWEKWAVVKNPDGTVGLRSSGGYFLRAAGNAVAADRPAADADGTRFTLEFADGYVAIKTAAGKYLSAQP